MVLPRSVPLPGGRTAPPVTVTVTVVPVYLNIGPRLRTYKQAAAMTTMKGQSQPCRDWDSSKSCTVLLMRANNPSSVTRPTRTVACNQSTRAGSLQCTGVRPCAHDCLFSSSSSRRANSARSAALKLPRSSDESSSSPRAVFLGGRGGPPVGAACVFGLRSRLESLIRHQVPGRCGRLTRPHLPKNRP